MSLEGLVAVVTGASSGSGRATALRLGREGADVCVNYRSGPDAAAAVCQEIRSLGRRAIAVRADVSQVADARRLVSETVEHLGHVDILVNDAGIEITHP